MAIGSATIPLGELLRQYHLKLTQITGLENREMLEAPVQWVHSTDLFNPYPFITPRTVLLTTGAQFGPASDEESSMRTYVAGLVEAGVCALGFAVGFNYQRIPKEVIVACQEFNLPLFRVPYSTPFIDIIQTAARLIDREVHAREAWSVSAHRTIANRALQGHGVNPLAHELSKQLDTWVAIYDAHGVRMYDTPPKPCDENEEAEVTRSIRDILKNQVRASRNLSVGSARFELQTLGRHGHLLGALLVQDTGSLDRSAHSVISFAVALLGTTLEQANALDGPLDQLKSARLELLIDGHVEFAKGFARESLAALPDEPIVVISAQPDTHGSRQAGSLLSALKETALGTQSFDKNIEIAALGSELVVVASHSEAKRVSLALTDTGYPSGISAPQGYAHFDRALDQARLARHTAEQFANSGVVTYSREMQRGVLALLDSHPDARDHARMLLEPLFENDARNEENLAHSLKVWLEYHGQFVPAAAELGVHRHTLKTRISRIRDLLSKDLESFETRAELFSALKLTNTT